MNPISALSAQRNKLFLVCPFSQMESFVTRHFGDAFFLTAPAAVFSLDDNDFKREVAAFLHREHITDVCIVVDTDCRFINGALAQKPPSALHCESLIRRLQKRSTTAHTLSERLIRQQLRTLGNCTLFSAKGVRLHGFVASKKENSVSLVA